MLSSSFGGHLQTSRINLDIQKGLTIDQIGPDIPNKCTIFVTEDPNQSSVAKIFSSMQQLITHVRQAPLFLIILSDTDVKPQRDLQVPLLSLIKGSQVFSLQCPYSVNIIRIPLSRLQSSQELCSFKGRRISIAYNNVAPYFTANSGLVDSNSLEYLFLQTFLTKHHLSAELIFANMTWGARNTLTGKWSGVVGMVNLLFRCHYHLDI